MLLVFLLFTLFDRPSFSARAKTLRNDNWSFEDERETDIPAAAMSEVSLDLNDVVHISCTTNCLVLQGTSSATLFTGTLRVAKAEHSMFLVLDDRIFEWTRGAAKSG